MTTKIPCCDDFSKIANTYLDKSIAIDRRIAAISALLPGSYKEIFDKNTLWTIHSMLSELLENRAVIQHALLGRDIADDDIHSKAIAVRKELDICDFQDEKEIEED